jgi:hypothetical protein
MLTKNEQNYRHHYGYVHPILCNQIYTIMVFVQNTLEHIRMVYVQQID